MTEKEEKKFIEECRSWLGTGWMHAVCVKGFRVDCVHYIIGVAKNMGWIPVDYEPEPYPHDWALHQTESRLVNELHKYCQLVKIENIKIGDLILYKFGKCNSHIAWYLGEGKAIHSAEDTGVEEFNMQTEMLAERTIVMRMRNKK
ncbi:MAG: hypothetical protein DDT42_00431 [candidate division WS2 bacterium]|uniref:NlpC/P60 domain-containing protein n=1 Tax=Psychracetigena formicireducens TaxID=2986056 RepID=A0A9E2BGI2_PSYF1|nr:hypothetical protein [Candidatus Psychracetigena formicireducens]